MPTPWSNVEIELIAADYIDMLIKERRGEKYSKKAHREKLIPLLNNRSHGSVEYKHQNISAVLCEMRHPIIDGYKPALNYQGGEFPLIVREAVLGDASLHQVLTEQLAHLDKLQLPNVEDILGTLVDPPQLASDRETNNPSGDFWVPPKVDYVAREARNQQLGLLGEQFAVRFEQARLLNSGKGHLADQVEHISLTNDTKGYDLKSYNDDGTDRFIEVKTTRYSRYTPFFVTENERQTAQNLANKYHLYRLFEFDQQPKLFQLPGPMDRNFRLEPRNYQAFLL